MAVDSYREDEQLQSVSRGRTLGRLLSRLLKYRLILVGVLACMAVTVAVSLVNPLLIERAIDVCIARGDMAGLYRLAAVALAINVLSVAAVKLRMYAMAKVTNQIILDIRQELYEHIQQLSFSFFDSRPTGKILARIMGDVNALKNVLDNTVTTLIPDFITICGVVAIMVAKDYKLALAGLSSIPAMMAAVCVIQKRAHQRWASFRKKGSNLNAYVHEDIAGMRVVQGFTAENETRETFGRLVDEHQDAFGRAVRVADLFGPAVDLFWGIGAMLLYWAGIRLIGVDSVSVGTLAVFGTYISMFWMPVMNLSNFYNQVVTNIAAAERVFDILDTEPDIVDDADVQELPDIQGQVEFSHVSFSYGTDRDGAAHALNDVSFTVRPGEAIALVGPTGAGKTTIVSLISRFYDVSMGTIRIDGHDIRKVSMGSLRRQMGVMAQESFIFQGSVLENIAYGRLDASREEIVQAAKAVNAHDFISKLKDGYDTQLKERGAGLSIGQRQLIAFARAMVSMPRILILDEATSSIDTQTELLVQQGIERLLAGRTSFIIAHRLSTIRRADRIFFIDQGSIVEQGSHRELMERKGAYYQLYMAQFREGKAERAKAFFEK